LVVALMPPASNMSLSTRLKTVAHRYLRVASTAALNRTFAMCSAQMPIQAGSTWTLVPMDALVAWAPNGAQRTE